MTTTTRTTGRPGHYSRKMQIASYVRSFELAAGAGVAALAALLLLIHGSYPGGLVMALGAAVCVGVSRHHLERAGKQGVGARSEEVVSAALGRVPGVYHVLNNVSLPGVRGDSDHIALCRSAGVVVVETKSGGGQVRLDGANRLITGQNRVCPGDPVGQCLAQASAASRLLKTRVSSVVVFPHMRNKPFQHRGVWICGTNELGWVLQRLGQGGHMTSAEADWCAARLPR
jgi:hypothetical protein